ncbi:uncharacterized protein LOC111626764 isoform X2 [Centruroides sculpturatus]|uniref:uncharacterized protein LOC111626764 isoform X2 n=1 Tax=Centruroides sculpturatus TaxID=218467 RepID=UPI000C6EE219|nr:uncharacterized protein LOC111626764 isoform X2 [Centruroides sculpturatus]
MLDYLILIKNDSRKKKHTENLGNSVYFDANIKLEKQRKCRKDEEPRKIFEKWDKLKLKLSPSSTLYHNRIINDSYSLPVLKRKPKICALTVKNLEIWDEICGQKMNMLEKYFYEINKCERDDIEELDEEQEDDNEVFKTGDDVFAKLNIPISEFPF